MGGGARPAHSLTQHLSYPIPHWPLSAAASLVMPPREGSQGRGFSVKKVPKKLNVSYGNNSQGTRKKYPEHNKHKKETGNLVCYVAVKCE